MNVPDRSKMFTKMTTLAESDDAGDVRQFTTPAQRWEMTYELSCRLYELKEKTLAQPGLHRHIVRVFKRES